jgi:hypothetical protein
MLLPPVSLRADLPHGVKHTRGRKCVRFRCRRLLWLMDPDRGLSKKTVFSAIK